MPIPSIELSYPIAAIAHNTAPEPTSPWVMPGQYSVALTVNGKTYTQPLTIKLDPRVEISEIALQQQYDLSRQLYEDALEISYAAEEADRLASLVGEAHKTAPNAVAEELEIFSRELLEITGSNSGPAHRQNGTHETFSRMRESLLSLMGILQEVDASPTTQSIAAVRELNEKTPALLERWSKIKARNLEELNRKLRAASLPEIQLH